jgi:hypothetical protein
LVHSILALFSTIFLIRFISDQASVMPSEPRTPSADKARGAARWVRAGVYAIAWLLNGPIAAFCVMLTCVLLLDHVIVPAFSLKWISEEQYAYAHAYALLSVGLAAAIGGYFIWSYGNRKKWGSTWTRFFGSFALVALIYAAAIGVHQMLPGKAKGRVDSMQANVVKAMAAWIGFTPKPPGDEAKAAEDLTKAAKGLTKAADGQHNAVEALTKAAEALTKVADGQAKAADGQAKAADGQAKAADGQAKAAAEIPYLLRGPIFLLTGVKVVFVLISLIVLALLVPWVYALRHAPDEWRPALGAAYGTALLQIGLWMLIAPGLALLSISSLVSDDTVKEELRQLFKQIEVGFAGFLIISVLIGFAAWIIWTRRSGWVKRFAGGFVFPQPGRDIDRLVVNSVLIGAVIVLTVLSCGISVTTAVSPGDSSRFHADAAGVIAVSGFALILSYFRQGLANWLHIITDIINHFYRRRDEFPRPWGKECPVEPLDFEIQQQIEARFRAVLKEILDDKEVTRLSVVCHSQGTVITVDAFSLENVIGPYREWLERRLRDVGGLNLVTMGSPVTHLYQHYLPHRYPPLASKDWDGLKQSIARWVNIYLIDDYIGTYIKFPDNYRGSYNGVSVAGAATPNRPIHAGGHTEYWTQPAVFEAIHQKQSGALPG